MPTPSYNPVPRRKDDHPTTDHSPSGKKPYLRPCPTCRKVNITPEAEECASCNNKRFSGTGSEGMNEKLGLPFGDGMQKVAFAFDVDGTLIDGDTITHDQTLDILRAIAYQDWKNVDVIVWSGGGADYARTQYRRITGDLDERSVKFHGKLEHEQLRLKYTHIIAVDDIQDTRIGDINLIVRNK